MIHVEMEGLHKIESDLGMLRDKSNIVLRRAINETAKTVNKEMVDGAHKKYIYKKKKADIKKANTIKKATVSKMHSQISAVGPSNELLDFRVSPSTYFPGSRGAPRWIKARAMRSEPFKRMALRPNAAGDKYKAFVVKYKSGHYALAQRVPGKKMQSKPWKEAVKSLLSLSVPKMEAVAYDENLEGKVDDILAKNIQQSIEQTLRYKEGKKK